MRDWNFMEECQIAYDAGYHRRHECPDRALDRLAGTYSRRELMTSKRAPNIERSSVSQHHQRKEHRQELRSEVWGAQMGHRIGQHSNAYQTTWEQGYVDHTKDR